MTDRRPVRATYGFFEDLDRQLGSGRSDYRVLLTSGVLVRALNVVGQLATDGAIELVSIDIDLSWD